MIDEYIDELIHSHINTWNNPLLRRRVAEMIKEAMKDQREACAAAILTVEADCRDGNLAPNKAHQAALDAEPKTGGE